MHAGHIRTLYLFMFSMCPSLYLQVHLRNQHLSRCLEEVAAKLCLRCHLRGASGFVACVQVQSDISRITDRMQAQRWHWF